MEIENNTELEALCARLLPKFNEYLARRSKNIFSCELATSLDGISSMPALYDSGGVRKQVIAPLNLISKIADTAAESATAAADRANKAAESMETVVSKADTAAQSATEAATKATEATDKANTAAERANTAAESTEEVVTQATEATTNANEAADKANTAAEKANTATTESTEQTTIAKGYNEHPTEIGDNNNWWSWNGTAYEDTGKPSRALTIYPSFYHRGNKLYIEDVNETMSAKMKRKGNKLVFSMVG